MVTDLLVEVTPAGPADAPEIMAVAQATGVFSTADLAIVAELLEAVRRDGGASGYNFVIARDGAGALGFACYGPTPLTLSTFDLYWIGTAHEARGRGAGSALMRHVEDAMVAQGAQLIMIETESRDEYWPARRLYERHGWTLEARIRDFYAPGSDRLLYAKRYGEPPVPPEEGDDNKESD
jgi:ribosomal protein S18 acetylase RimI-like enzyme